MNIELIKLKSATFFLVSFLIAGLGIGVNFQELNKIKKQIDNTEI